MSPMSEARDPQVHPSRAGWSEVAILVGVLATIYMISQFLRNSIGVIGPDLAREFDLDAASLSLLASIFFLSFALVQIPVGMAIDRYGPRAVILATACVVIVGAIGFAVARGYSDLLAARVIIGLGCSSFLMGPLAIYAMRFPPERFSSIVGIQVAGGNLGTLAATAPLALAAATIGWRGAFGAIACVSALAALLVFIFVRETQEARVRRQAKRESAGELLRGVVEAGRTPSFTRVFLMQMASYPAFGCILGLWSGPWLSDVYGMDLAERGRLMLVMVGAQIIGLFVWGSADRLFSSYKIPVILGAALGVCALAAPALGVLPREALWVWAAVFGFIFGYMPVLTAHGKALFPDRLMGRGLSLMNIASIGGVFALQISTGAMITLFPVEIIGGARVYPPDAYRTVFAFLAIQLAIITLAYLTTPEARGANILNKK
jgi:predicted MFS family arabinose efflux permease